MKGNTAVDPIVSLALLIADLNSQIRALQEELARLTTAAND